MDWYYSQPTINVGGGYSSAFFWIMMTEWSADRRASWLYHNQHTIERDAYERGMRDAETARALAELKARNESVNPDYVDPDFVDNPGLMYTDEYVQAAYNPVVATPKHVGSGGVGTILVWLLVIAVVGGAVYLLLFRVRFGE